MIGIPPTLTIIGIVWNSLYIVHDQPLEQDPASKLARTDVSNDEFAEKPFGGSMTVKAVELKR